MEFLQRFNDALFRRLPCTRYSAHDRKWHRFAFLHVRHRLIFISRRMKRRRENHKLVRQNLKSTVLRIVNPSFTEKQHLFTSLDRSFGFGPLFQSRFRGHVFDSRFFSRNELFPSPPRGGSQHTHASPFATRQRARCVWRRCCKHRIDRRRHTHRRARALTPV